MKKIQYTKNDTLHYLRSEPHSLNNKDAKNIIDNFFNKIIHSVTQNNKVKFNKFGSFQIGTRASKKAKNFSTGEVIYTKESKKIVFTKSSLNTK